MPVTNTKFDQVVLDLIESAGRNLKALPINLGGVAGTGGGIGGPPGGFVGRLPQTRVTYDESEIGTDYTPVSGMSLVDNLNHIRHRINILESGTLTVKEWDGIPSIPNVTTIVFSGAVNVVNNGGGEVEVQITASGGGGGISDAPSDGTTYGRKDAAWALLNNEFLRLDASNDPLTGKLAVIPSTDDDGIYIEINSDSYPLDLEQFTVNTLIGSSTIWLYRETTGTGNIVAPMIEGYQGAYGTGTITGEFIHLEDDVTGKFFSVNNGGNVNIPTGSTYNINGTPHIHSGYMEKSYNLSDVANVATARTNLGLVAGGAGDIWVEKAGDSMTGQLLIQSSTDTQELIVKAKASQTTNLTEWKNSGGSNLLSVSPNGFFAQSTTWSNPTGESAHNLVITKSGTPPSISNQRGINFQTNLNYSSPWYRDEAAAWFIMSANTSSSGGAVYPAIGGVFRAQTEANGIVVQKIIGGRFYAASLSNRSGYALEMVGGEFKIDPQVSSGTPTVTSTKALAVLTGTKTAGVVVTNNYGLHIEDQTYGTTNYAIYTSLGDNSFGDDIVLRNDGDKIRLGALSTGDLYLTHDGTNSIIYNDTGLLKIQDAGSGINLATTNTEKIGLFGVTPVVQPTTAHAEASFIENSGGTVVNVDSTFDGYTVQQVVKALRDLGVLT